jgi:hypothetical protein
VKNDLGPVHRGLHTLALEQVAGHVLDAVAGLLASTDRGSAM